MKTIGGFFWTLIKLTLFSIVILILANRIEWKGKTLSDQVKTQMSQVEHSETFQEVQGYAKTLTNDVKQEIEETLKPAEAEPKNKKTEMKPPKSKRVAASEKENILPTEKEKLRSLINDLNKSY